MKGSAKQIAWAEKIQEEKADAAKSIMGKNQAADRVINSILAIDNACFWIDYRNYEWRTMLSSLQREGLRVKGLDHSNIIKIDKSMTITETWEEIVQDGKGGYMETKSKVW